MGDAWGGSWGAAWGLSWTRGAEPPTPEPEIPPDLGGGRIIPTRPADNRTTSTPFTRERYRALRREIDHEHELARERAEKFKRKSDRKRAVAAVENADDAIERLKRAELDQAAGEELKRLRAQLQDAQHASVFAEFMQAMAAAQIAVDVLLQRKAAVELAAAEAARLQAITDAIVAENARIAEAARQEAMLEADDEEAFALMLLM